MTKIEAQNLFIESIKLLKSLNIPISEYIDQTLHFKVRMGKHFGYCHSQYMYSRSCYSSWIELNETFVLNGSYNGIRNTILHELLHTINPKDGHRGQWKIYAGIVNEMLGVNIQRCDGDKTDKDIELVCNSKRKVKYILECPTCGNKWRYYRYTQKVKAAECGHLHCTECLNKFDRKFDERSKLYKVEL